MERKLIVTLLQKNIQELAMITEGFMEMTEYPAVIIQLARQKTEDILDYVSMLEEIKKGNVPKLPYTEEDTVDVAVPYFSEEDIEALEQAVDEAIEEEILIEQQRIAEEEARIKAEEAEKEVQRLAKELADEEAKAKKIAEEETRKEAQRLAEEEERLADEARKLAEEEKKRAEETSVAERARQIAELEEKRKAEEARIFAEKAEEAKRLLAEEKARKEAEEAKKQAEKTAVVEKPVEETKHKTVASEHIKQKGENETKVSDAHTQKKIDDINQAISMGNRFRFQRELFDGNGELMNKTLAKLNQMSSFDEADEFLQKNFKWQSDNETIDSFYQIIKRKFI